MAGRSFVRGSGTGTASIWSLGGHWTTLVGHGDTDGKLALMEAVMYRTTEPPLHIHHHEAEAWYVLDGQMTFQVGDRTLLAENGSFAYAPPGLPHAFTVDVEPTRVLVFAMPAGFEAFAQELGVPAMSTEPPADLVIPGPEILGPIAGRFGIEVVGPPLRPAGWRLPPEAMRNVGDDGADALPGQASGREARRRSDQVSGPMERSRLLRHTD